MATLKKRSLLLSGHATSIALEPEFWSVLEEMAAEAPKVEIQGQGLVPRLFYTYLNEENKFVGEDFAF